MSTKNYIQKYITVLIVIFTIFYGCTKILGKSLNQTQGVNNTNFSKDNSRVDAIDLGDKKVVEQLIAEQQDVNAVDTEGNQSFDGCSCKRRCWSNNTAY